MSPEFAKISIFDTFLLTLNSYHLSQTDLTEAESVFIPDSCNLPKKPP